MSVGCARSPASARSRWRCASTLSAFGVHPRQRPRQPHQQGAQVSEGDLGRQAAVVVGRVDETLDGRRRGLTCDLQVRVVEPVEGQRDHRGHPDVEHLAQVRRDAIEPVLPRPERALRRRQRLLQGVEQDRLDQRIAVAEPAVQRADPDACPPGHLFERAVQPALDEQLAGSVQHLLLVAAGIGPQRLLRGHPASLGLKRRVLLQLRVRGRATSRSPGPRAPTGRCRRARRPRSRRWRAAR